MDEPFSALDPLIRRQLQGLFKGLMGNLNKTTLFITHDLEEAVRMGDRIAILRDGQVVQVGTPEEIILQPVDSYVGNFVADISSARVLKARSIVMPLSENAITTADLERLPRVHESDQLESILALAVQNDCDLLVVNSSGDAIGVVTQGRLLKAMARRPQ
jgi:glycine betaine/proline transport system ATP-binding protein